MGISPARYSYFLSFGHCSTVFKSCVHESRCSRTTRRSRNLGLHPYRRSIVGISGDSRVHEYRYHGSADQRSCGIPKGTGQAGNERYRVTQVRWKFSSLNQLQIFRGLSTTSSPFFSSPSPESPTYPFFFCSKYSTKRWILLNSPASN